jgi:predicted component of type VI protein secretion system
MKTILNLFTLLLFFCSCQDSKPKEEPEKVITVQKN